MVKGFFLSVCEYFCNSLFLNLHGLDVSGTLLASEQERKRGREIS